MFPSVEHKFAGPHQTYKQHCLQLNCISSLKKKKKKDSAFIKARVISNAMYAFRLKVKCAFTKIFFFFFLKKPNLCGQVTKKPTY